MVQASATTPGLIKHDKKHRLKQRFEVKHKLGQGSYGKVQLAINKETGQEVAIKTIKKSKIQSEQDLVRIRREIQIMSSIQHPHIIHIYEVFENKEKIVLVMQYASGGELYEYISDRKVLSDNEARRLFRQIATAVYYCHKNKVCHRDLKLENILLDHNGNAKIADFGLSNVFDEKHFLSTFCGSPLYASPEIVKGIPYYGAEVDCWSLGVLLYTLVYGAMPFDGSHFKRLVKQISESSYYEPKQKSEASGLIRRLLAVDPTKRGTIIDICTDCWVNKGYEHSLLQVAEDLANLTPVRLDVLLALAPISPPVETGAGQHPLADRESDLPGDVKTKRSKSKSCRSDEALYPPSTATADYPADTSELSTDIPTYAEEEEEELADASEIVDDGDEFLPSAVAAALQDECQEPVTPPDDVAKAQSLPVPGTSSENTSEPGKSTKRIAGSSFDSNSVGRVSSVVMKRKKPKKCSEDLVVTESEDQQVSSSGYMSDGASVTGGIFPPSQIITDDLSHQTLVTVDDASVVTAQNEGERVEDDTTMLNKTSSVPYDSLPDENASISSQISSLPETGRDSRRANSKGKPLTSGETSKTQSSASIETLTAKESREAPSECEMTSSSSTLIDDQQKLSRQSTSRSSVKSKSKSASPKRPMTSKNSLSSFTSTSSSSTIVSGKQPPTVSSSSSSSAKSVPEKRTKPGDRVAQKSAKEPPPKGVIKGKVEDQVKASTSTMPASTLTSPSISTVTTTATSSTLRESPSTSAPGSEASESVPTTPDADKTKPWLERRSSVDRKVGRISYPKFLENKSAPEKKPVPTYGKISTAKKMFETRRSSVDRDKERVIPMVKVSDAKRAFERRASMPTTQAPLWKNAGERKVSLVQQTSLDETTTNTQSTLSKDKSTSLENNKQSTVRPRKSPSSPVKSRSPNKSPVKTVTSKQSSESKPHESKQIETTKDSPKPKVKSTSSIVINSETKKIGANVQSNQESKSTKSETKSVDVKSSESGSFDGKGESSSRLIESPSILDSNEEERKSLAKDVIKKQIAKAKLQELRQSSIESNLSVSSDQHGTKLSCQTGSSDESTKPKSYVKAPQPFIKDEIKPTPVRSVAEIKLSSKPKLGLDIEAAHRDQKKLPPNQSDEIEEITPTNIIEPPSTAGTIQNQESNPGTPSTANTTLSKAAPITRSYKKVTFTKDGACITETGKIISEESADGSFSRIEKKSKVTHYSVGPGSGASTTRSESSEETRTVKNLGESVKSVGDSFDESRNGSLSPPPVAPSTSGLRRSESASSSGSTDIFDDIFDTWSGDPVFGNISGRMRSMLSSSRSPFTSLWGTGRNKRAKKKSRAESAERKPTLASSSGWRRAGHGTDQEFSDTDTDTEPSMGFGSAGTGGGLWKFLGTTPSSTNLMDRHRSLLSRHFGSDDFFSDAEPFGSSFRRSLSRDRGSTSFGTTRNSSAGTPTMRMVINPLRTPRSPINRMTSTPAKQDSLDSNESGGSNTQQHVSLSSHQFTGRPYSRTVSRESQRQREGVGGTEEKSNPGGGGNSFDMEDGSSSGPASRRRVEQWLDMSRDDEEIGVNHPISMYTTIRPRPINRYGRSVSSRFGFDLGSVDSPRENFQEPSGGSNLSFNTTQEIQIGPSNTTKTTSGKPRAEVIIPVGRVSSPSIGTPSSQGKPMITMKLSLGGGNEPREVRTFISSGSGGGLGGGGSSSGIVDTTGSADSFGGDWSSPILLPESSSLLDQLRTHGYRNLVTQRLSGLSGPSGVGGEGATRYDNRDNSCVSTTTTTTTSTTTTPTTNTTVNLPPQQMKRGKSLTGDSSSIRNQNENLIVKNGQIYFAWSNPGQPRTVIESTNHNSMPNKSMDHPTITNPNSDNSVNQDNERKLISSNRIVKVVKQPVDDQSVGVNCSNRNQKKRIEVNHQAPFYENIKFIDDGEGNGDDDVKTTNTNNKSKDIGQIIKAEEYDKGINKETNRKLNCYIKSGAKRKETAIINIPIQRLSSNDNGNRVTSYFSSSITKVTSSLPPKPKPYNPKHEPDDKLLIGDNQTNHQVHHHHHHPNLNPNQVPSFHLHQKPQSTGEGELKPLTPTTTTFNRESIETQQKQEEEQAQHNSSNHRKQQSNDIKTCNNNHLTSKDVNDKTINRKNVNNIDDNSHRSLNSPNITIANAPFNDPHHKETLQERILRKSYYSRFNHPLERRASSVRRRTSMIENSDRPMDFSLFDNLTRHHHPSSTPVTPSAGTSSLQSSFDNHHHNYSSNPHLKPPLYLTNDQFIERVQVRAQQLIEEARERHSRINSQLMSSFRPMALDLNDDPIVHHSLRNHSSPSSSHLSSHSTSSSHRSREQSPSTLLRRTSSFSGQDEFYLNNNKFRRPSSSSSTTTPTSTINRTSVGTLFNGSNKSTSNRSSAHSCQSTRTCSTRLMNGHSQELDDDDEDDYDYNTTRSNGDPDGDYLGDDLTTRAQVVSDALQKLKERVLRDN